MKECFLCLQSCIIPIQLKYFPCSESKQISCHTFQRICISCFLSSELLKCSFCHKEKENENFQIDFLSIQNDEYSILTCPFCKDFQGNHMNLWKHMNDSCISFCKCNKLYLIKKKENHFKKECLSEYGHHYVTGLKYAESEFTKFKNKSTPIVNYLVKEFEMRKSARLHARASTDKTGVIDPLKLHTYKFAEDIFKKMTIVPNEKNHGMIFLLDWSGSMANYLMPTVEQLLNLVWFVKKVNIPFSVYAFMNPGDHKYEREISNSFQIKNGDLKVDQSTKLVQLFTHKMSKTDMLLSGKTLYTMAHYYNDRYGYRRGYDEILDKGYTVSPHIDYHLSSTPLDESLIAMDTIIKQFKDQNKVDKTIFVALTDGGANSIHGVHGNQTSGDLWVKLGKNYVQCESWWRSGKSLTDRLLVYLKKKHNIKTIGFFLVNKFQNLRHHIDSLRESDLLRKAFNKDKVIAYKKSGYDVYYFVKADTNVSDNNLDEITADSKKSEIKKLFAKNMKGRLVSRVVLNKFIREVA